MSAFERLQELTFTPEKMTAAHWVIWNSRASLSRDLLEQAAQQLENLIRSATGMYYTPKDLECQANIMIKGIDCKDRTKDTGDWCDHCKEKYIKIIDPANGSGNFLNNIVQNPPFGKKE